MRISAYINDIDKTSIWHSEYKSSTKYLAENGQEKEWYHSFFYSNIYYYHKLHYSLITKDRWFWYISPNLLKLNNKPVKIKEIQVYGFGWEFTGQVAEVNIIGY